MSRKKKVRKKLTKKASKKVIKKIRNSKKVIIISKNIKTNILKLEAFIEVSDLRVIKTKLKEIKAEKQKDNPREKFELLALTTTDKWTN